MSLIGYYVSMDKLFIWIFNLSLTCLYSWVKLYNRNLLYVLLIWKSSSYFCCRFQLFLGIFLSKFKTYCFWKSLSSVESGFCYWRCIQCSYSTQGMRNVQIVGFLPHDLILNFCFCRCMASMMSARGSMVMPMHGGIVLMFLII